MRSVFVTLLAIAACAFSACAAHDSPPPQHPVAVASTAAADCQAKPTHYREMTWSEYYTRVKERAWRTGATVIWVHPPRVRVASNNAKTACR